MAHRAICRTIILSVTVYTITHSQNNVLSDLLHARDISMTLGAFESSLDMDFMDELDMVGKSVNTFPIDGLFIIPGCGKFLDLWFVFASYFMTEHALFHSGDARRGFLGYVSVAEGAVDSQFLDMHCMGKVDWLLRGRSLAQHYPGEDEPEAEYYHD